MSLISKSTIQEVNNRLDAVAIIGDYLRLEQKSGRWWGRCPFHGGGQEKTPSFKVDPDLKMYHCFGCGKGGSVIGFVMEMDKLSYPEAIKNLARKIGVEVVYEEGGTQEGGQNSSFKEELYELYRRTTVTFQHFLHKKLEGKAAFDYIQERGISADMIDRFKLGYSPSDRNFLHKFLRQKGYSDDFLDKSGLFSSRYKTIPLFSGRLMFPISDKQGRIVAFGGRVMPGIKNSDGSEPPKYINSPETEVYKKSQTLFAIDHAKAEIRQSKCAYLAEGYMDVLALHNAGITNSVAPLGTAFTDEQAKWLGLWAEKVILVFDTDEAGQKAAYKAITSCRKNGRSCALVQIQEGLQKEAEDANSENFKDPADILQKFGSQILKKITNYVINDFEYLLSRSKSQYAAEKGDLNRAAAFMFPYLDALDSEVDRDDSITRIADTYKIDRDAVQKDYTDWKTGGFRNVKDKQADVSVNQQIRRNAELCLLADVAINMELYPEFRTAVEIRDIDDLRAKEIFIALEECYKHDESGTDYLLARINDDALRNFIADRGTSREYKDNPRKIMEDGIKSIRKKIFDKRLREINSLMRESERTPDAVVNIDELLAEKKFIDTQIRKLEGR